MHGRVLHLLQCIAEPRAVVCFLSLMVRLPLPFSFLDENCCRHVFRGFNGALCNSASAPCLAVHRSPPPANPLFLIYSSTRRRQAILLRGRVGRHLQHPRHLSVLLDDDMITFDPAEWQQVALVHLPGVIGLHIAYTMLAVRKHCHLEPIEGQPEPTLSSSAQANTHVRDSCRPAVP